MKIYENVANSKRDEILLKDYCETQNESYLKSLIIFGNEDLLAMNIQKIWLQKPSGYLKNKIVKKLMNNHIKKMDFIESIDPEHFLFILCNSKQVIEDKILMKCFNEISEEIKHFAIYNLSKTGKWNLIEQEVKKYIS